MGGFHSALPRFLFTCRGDAEVLQAQHKRPSSITVTFKQLGQVYPAYGWQWWDLPASCKKHVASHCVLFPLELQHNWLLSLPSPTKSIEGPTSSSHDISKGRLFTPDWLKKCKETLPGPACSLLCLLVGGHLSSHGQGTGKVPSESTC